MKSRSSDGGCTGDEYCIDDDVTDDIAFATDIGSDGCRDSVIPRELSVGSVFGVDRILSVTWS